MSVYTIRHIEAYLPQIDGDGYYVEDLPTKADGVKDSSVYVIHGKNHGYYKYDAESNVWNKIEKPEYKWTLLSPLTLQRYKKTKAYYKVNLRDEWREMKEYEEHYKALGREISDVEPDDVVEKRYYNDYADHEQIECYDKDGNSIYMKIHTDWANNGGAIRDEYIKVNGFGEDYPFKGRGIPDDIASETYNDLLDNDQRLRGYDHTWVTLAEWCQLLNSEETRIFGMLKESYQKTICDKNSKKLDFLIKNMKDPMSADMSELDDVNTDDECYDEMNDIYYDSPNYIINEYMPYLYNIQSEITRTESLMEMYGLYGAENENVRIIYYLEH